LGHTEELRGTGLVQGETHGFSNMCPKTFLLDSKGQLSWYSVALTTASSMLNLRDLRLDDARALLEHDPACSLPKPEESPTVYLQSIIDNLCELSQKDPLTGLANRRHFRNVLSREIDVVARSGDSALLLMMDIDHFKKVNDTYGHLAGDRVLQAIANCLKTCVRPMDTVARYGGEEFAAILPNCSPSFGQIVAKRIREAVGNLSIFASPLVSIQVTISIGGAYAPEWVRSTNALWTDRADLQLYRAKSEGRNRVYIEHQREIAVSAEEKRMLFSHLAIGDPAWLENISNDASDDVAGSTINKVNS
jgi:two-component system cell cycle response regulator